jgi:hypothetical protein
MHAWSGMIALGEHEMERKSAKILVDLFVRQSFEQIDVLKMFESQKSSGEISDVRTVIGRTLGALYADALQPIFKQYPELKPSHFP